MPDYSYPSEIPKGVGVHRKPPDFPTLRGSHFLCLLPVQRTGRVPETKGKTLHPTYQGFLRHRDSRPTRERRDPGSYTGRDPETPSSPSPLRPDPGVVDSNRGTQWGIWGARVDDLREQRDREGERGLGTVTNFTGKGPLSGPAPRCRRLSRGHSTDPGQTEGATPVEEGRT